MKKLQELDYVDVLLQFEQKVKELNINPSVNLLNEVADVRNVLNIKIVELPLTSRNQVLQSFVMVDNFINAMKMQGNNFVMFVSSYVPFILSEIAKVKEIVC